MIAGFGGKGVIAFVEFLGFIGLMKQGRVEGCIPFTESNMINTTNTMNTINKLAGSEGDSRVGGYNSHLLRVIRGHLLRVIYRGYGLSAVGRNQ